ncbi:MAG: nuclear transport factor 2 family protein [Chloroflexota bacterium]
MTARSNEEVVNDYLEAHMRHDFERLASLRAPKWFQEYPQSRERIRGHANDEAMMRNWPGGTPQALEARIRGSEDRWVLTPSWTYQRVVGSGDLWWMDGTADYPDGSTWHVIGMFQVHDGQIHEETWYFGPSLEAPSWRSEWVEPMTGKEHDHER